VQVVSDRQQQQQYYQAVPQVQFFLEKNSSNTGILASCMLGPMDRGQWAEIVAHDSGFQAVRLTKGGRSGSLGEEASCCLR
jgi:hypothetical protein